MAPDRQARRHYETQESPGDGPAPGRRRVPSRGFKIGMAAVVLLALFLAAVGALAAQSSSGNDSGPPPTPLESPIPIEVTTVPPQVTPDPDYTIAIR